MPTKTPCSTPDNCRGEVRALAAEQAFNSLIPILEKAKLDARLALEAVEAMKAGGTYDASHSLHSEMLEARAKAKAEYDDAMGRLENANVWNECLKAENACLRLEMDALQAKLKQKL